MEFSIGEVAGKLGVNKQTLRKWEKDFNLKVPRNEMGHRYYTEYEVEILENIQNMKDEGANIRVINKILSRSETAKEQREQALELVTLDKLTGKELKEMMIEQISDIVVEREVELKKEYESKIDDFEESINERISKELEKQEIKIREQINSENAKLLNYMKERDKNNKKSWWKKIFKKRKLN